MQGHLVTSKQKPESRSISKIKALKGYGYCVEQSKVLSIRI